MKGIARKLSVVAFIIAIGAAAPALAHGGFGGYGYGGMMGPGYGYGHMMGPGYGPYNMGPGMMGPGYGYMMGPGMMGWGGHRGWSQDPDDLGLSPQQEQQLESARNSFYQATADLRSQLDDQYAQLRQEFAKTNPDRSRVQDIQRTISKLEGQLAQKRLDFQLEARKIAPQLGEGYAGGGYGYGYGPGAGYCWR